MSCYIDQMRRTELLTDEVWAQLDPRQAQLVRISRRAAAALTAAALLLTALVVAVLSSGVLRASVGVSSSSGSAEQGSRVVRQSFVIDNRGWTEVRIAAVQDATRGTTLIHLDGAPGPIPAHGSTGLVLTYRIDDCAAVRPGTDLAAHLRLDRWWGVQTVTVGVGAAGLPWVACGHAS
jgi:hypothetical protein